VQLVCVDQAFAVVLCHQRAALDRKAEAKEDGEEKEEKAELIAVLVMSDAATAKSFIDGK
jgi:hypothetical protein